MADFPAKPMSLQKAIKEALEPYDRKFMSNLVADAVFQAIDNSWQRNPRFNFLKCAENPEYKPAIPKSLLNVSKIEERSRPVICNNCKRNFLLRVHYWLQVQELHQFSCVFDSPIFEENNMLQRHIANQQSSIADQQLSSLKVLFDFIEENYYDFQSVDI